MTLSTQDNAKLLKKLKPAFDKTIDWDKITAQRENQYLDYLINPSEWVNKLFVLLFEDNVVGTRDRRYFLPNVEIKTYNVIIDRGSFLISQ